MPLCCESEAVLFKGQVPSHQSNSKTNDLVLLLKTICRPFNSLLWHFFLGLIYLVSGSIELKPVLLSRCQKIAIHFCFYKNFIFRPRINIFVLTLLSLNWIQARAFKLLHFCFYKNFIFRPRIIIFVLTLLSLNWIQARAFKLLHFCFWREAYMK